METIFSKSWLVTTPLIIICGIVATLIMTVFMNIVGQVTGRLFKVPRLLGSMLSLNTQPDGQASREPAPIVFGIIVHYLIGIIYMSIYFILWKYEVMQVNFLSALFMGGVTAFVAIAAWYVLFAAHPNPPRISLGDYLIAIFFAHLVFALSCFALFQILVFDLHAVP